MAEEGMQGGLYLKVFLDRSELVRPDGTVEEFPEGVRSAEANARFRQIDAALGAGFLQDLIDRCRRHEADLTVGDDHRKLVDELVASVTSEKGRGIVCLTVLQLCVKAIVPEQSIRLHKGGASTSDFSWLQGISMRSLDKKHNTRILRDNHLMKLNADGFMMTRSLAENYPYTPLYKARMRGAQAQWMGIVDAVEDGSLNPLPALAYLLSQLINRSDDFIRSGDTAIAVLAGVETNAVFSAASTTSAFIWNHVTKSDYAARLMEIAMHSLMQVVQEVGGLGDGELYPLSQMRNANKKHGNIGDVEVMEIGQIREAWDAKYGKDYLRDELEELSDKLERHPDVRRVGFVTSTPVTRRTEIEPRLHDIEDQHDVDIEIVQFEEWVAARFAETAGRGLTTESILARGWIRAYTESLALRRVPVAPIDEPCDVWLADLVTKLQTLAK